MKLSVRLLVLSCDINCLDSFTQIELLWQHSIVVDTNIVDKRRVLTARTERRAVHPWQVAATHR